LPTVPDIASNGNAAAYAAPQPPPPPPSPLEVVPPAFDESHNGAIVPTNNGRIVPLNGAGGKPYANGNGAHAAYEPIAQPAKRSLFGGLFGKKREEEIVPSDPNEPSVADRIARDFGLLGDTTKP
jgi:hypothetical protein